MEIELLVKLIIPDNVAITTFHTLERLGFAVGEIKREDYYVFDVKKNEKQFMRDIGTVDILVNANKNKFTVKRKDEPFVGEGVKLLVKSKENDAAALLSTLQKRLGFTNIKTMEKGVLWTITPADKKLAEKIAKELLVNEHYQECSIL